MEEINFYTPCEDEEYMNPKQLQHFKSRLLAWRDELRHVSQFAKSELKQSKENSADLFDVAANNADFALGIEDMERNRKNLTLIDKALIRIESGEYGYCDLTGEEIGLKRLSAQPTAALCIEVQEMLERNNQMTNNTRQTGYML